jgi:hypothetical protein
LGRRAKEKKKVSVFGPQIYRITANSESISTAITFVTCILGDRVRKPVDAPVHYGTGVSPINLGQSP